MFKVGDIIKFNPKYKGMFVKKEIPQYICTYKGQGIVDVEYQLQDGDIFEILDAHMGHIRMKPLLPHIPNHKFFTYYTSDWDKDKYELVPKDVLIKLKIKLKKNERKLKLDKINETYK